MAAKLVACAVRPVDALQKAIEYSFARSDGRLNTPGAMVERMPKEIRESLAALTSDDALNLRPDYLHPRPK